MLEELAVENLVIIDRVQVGFHPGFNAISGETGVGKSLLLRALDILLGGRLGSSEPATGTCRIEGRFRLDASVLSEGLQAFASDDPTEWVVRILKKSGGKQRCYINGSMASRREVSELGQHVADIQGQDDRQRLLRHTEQTAILDRFSGSEVVLEQWQSVWQRLRTLREQAANRCEREKELSDRLDLGSFQCDELERAEITEGETEELSVRSRRARAAAKSQVALEGARVALNDIIDKARESGADLEHLADQDDRLQPLAESLFALVEGADDALRDVMATGEGDGETELEIENLESRLAWLQDLARKHRTDEAGLLLRLEEGREELQQITDDLEQLKVLDEALAKTSDEAVQIATELMLVRRRGAEQLEASMKAELSELGMPHANLQFDDGIEGEKVSIDDLNPGGAGRPKILFQANPGGRWEDLSIAASGGELSRVLLALHSLFAGIHSIPLVVFDEIEAGVGPRLGLMLGKRLAALSRSHQVLAITHLPQLASFADRHLKIVKNVQGSSTSVQVELIEGEARADELADMLGGGHEGLARQQAASLLKEAESRADS